MSAAGDFPRRHPSRTFWLKLLVAGLLVLSLVGWLRVQQTLVDWMNLAALGVNPGPLYLVITGALTGAAALVSAVGVWLRLGWAFVYTRVFVLVWQAWDWADRLWLSRSDTALSAWPFALAATVLILMYVFAVLDEEGRRLHETRRSRDRG